MRENTPPRVADIEDDDAEVVEFDSDEPPPDDDDYDGAGDEELEMEEVTLEELEARLAGGGGGGEPHDDRPDDAKLTFRDHNAPVFTCALHPQRTEWAATGGEDDTVYVWNTQTGDVLHRITTHKDTVTAVMFNFDGSYLATGDMAGTILVHKLQATTARVSPRADGDAATAETVQGVTLRQVWEYAMGDMSWMRWHRGANVLLGGSESGEIYMWRIPSGDCKILPGEGVRCEAGDLTSDGKKLFASYGNGVLKLWDLKTCATVMEVNAQHPQAHQECATAVACDPEAPLYMSGSMEGKILFCSNNGPVGSVDADGPVECVAFSPSTEFKMAASGTLHGQIAIWDYGKYNLRTLCEHPEQEDGIAKLKWLNSHILLVVTLLGNVHIYDARSGTRKCTLSGHHEDIYDFCFNSKENILLTASEDYTAKVFQLPDLDD